MTSDGAGDDRSFSAAGDDGRSHGTRDDQRSRPVDGDPRVVPPDQDDPFERLSERDRPADRPFERDGSHDRSVTGDDGIADFDGGSVVSRRAAVGLLATGVVGATVLSGYLLDGERDRREARAGLRELAVERAGLAERWNGQNLADTKRIASSERLTEASDADAFLSKQANSSDRIRSVHHVDGGEVVASSRAELVGDPPADLPGLESEWTERDRDGAATVAIEPFVAPDGTPRMAYVRGVPSVPDQFVLLVASLDTLEFGPAAVDGEVSYLLLEHGFGFRPTVCYDSSGQAHGDPYPPDLYLAVGEPWRMMPDDASPESRNRSAKPKVERIQPEGDLTTSIPREYRDDEFFAAYAPAGEDLAVVVHAPTGAAVERFGDDGTFFALQ